MELENTIFFSVHDHDVKINNLDRKKLMSYKIVHRADKLCLVTIQSARKKLVFLNGLLPAAIKQKRPRHGF